MTEATTTTTTTDDTSTTTDTSTTDTTTTEADPGNLPDLAALTAELASVKLTLANLKSAKAESDASAEAARVAALSADERLAELTQLVAPNVLDDRRQDLCALNIASEAEVIVHVGQRGLRA